MGKRRRRKFTGEFKKEAVRLFREGERSIGQVARCFRHQVMGWTPPLT